MWKNKTDDDEEGFMSMSYTHTLVKQKKLRRRKYFVK